MRDMEDSKKKNMVIRYVLIILAIIFVILIVYFAFSKFTSNINGIATSTTGKQIYETKVENFEADEDMLHPYAIVTVKNYNDNNEITHVNLDYEISIEALDNKPIPEYYFTDTDGNNIGEVVNGTFGISEKELKTYRINFVNVGDAEITRNIKVISTVAQSK